MQVPRLCIILVKVTIISTVFIGVTIISCTFAYNKAVNFSRYIAASYFNINHVAIHKNYFYTNDDEKIIRECIVDYAKNNTFFSFDTKELYKLLKTRCRLIKSFNCSIHAPSSIDIFLTGVTPYCVINDDYVLANKRRLFLRKSFMNINLDDLSHVSINPKLCTEKLSDRVVNFLYKIPAWYWKNFNMTYHNQSYIELVPVASPYPCTIIVDEKTFFNKKKLVVVESIFDDMVKRGLLLQKTLVIHNSRVTFDVRFDYRVIVKCKDGFAKRGMGL
jgi:hypothetical protein